MSETKYIEFESEPISPGDTTKWFMLPAGYKGKIIAIAGRVVDPTDYTTGSQQLEKFVSVEYKINRQSKTAKGALPMSQLVGLQGNERPVSYDVDKDTQIEVQFTNGASAGNDLVASLSFRNEAEDLDTP